MQALKQFFSAPNLPDDETNRKAGLLSFLLNLHIVVSVGTAILSLLASSALIFPLVALFVGLLGIGMRLLLQRGRLDLSSSLFLGMAIFIMPLVSWFSESSAASVTVTAFQFMTVVMAGLLLGGVGAGVFVIFTVAINGGLIYAEVNNLYLVNTSRDPIFIWLMQSLTFSAIATILYVTNRLIRESFARAQKENSERKRAEEIQRKLITELEQRNAELERFTYTVSHDLKSPLVTIKGFLGMLKKDMEQNQADRIQNDMQRISGATEKMGALLSDLLELSRIGRQVNPPEEVDLVRVINDAIELLNAHILSSNAAINISPDLPVVWGDRIRLREVFENLIENAIKYKSDQSNPVIEIGQLDRDGQSIIFVRDNGIGIESQYQTKIFGLFEKLNPASEGTGIGLALVKRIIEVHGGRIWVESDGLGKGSTFCFTIPDGMDMVERKKGIV